MADPMPDLHCALTDPAGLVTDVVVCCGGDPATCSLHPTRVPENQGIGPGWTVAGGLFSAPPVPPAPVPAQITTRQFVIQAQATTLPGQTTTLWDTIKRLFASQPALADVFWASAVIARTDPMFLGAAQMLGIDASTQDAFFSQAATR